MVVQQKPVLTDPNVYAHGDPHAAWSWLRRKCPVSWHDEAGHEPFWAVTTYAEGFEVLTDWSRFSSTNGTFLRPNLSDPFPGAEKMMTLIDPPRHTVLRRVLNPLFTPRAVGLLRGHARATARSLIERVTDNGTRDFIRDVTAKFPLTVTASLLGVAPEDIPLIASHTSVAADYIVDIDGAVAQQAHLEVLRYYADVMEQRRARPTGDIVSALVRAQADGLAITDEEIVLTCDNLVVAAGETTRQVLGGGLLALLDNPDQLAMLRAGRISTQRAVEELLRWAMPVSHIMRTAKVDTAVAGADIRAGQAVSVWLPSVNRDEKVFDHATEFRLDRHPNRHMSFGGGRHFCIGAPMARMMLAVFLEELVRGTGDIVLDGVPR